MDHSIRRLVIELALIVLALTLGLEVVHYREAVLAANVDRKRAWETVIELRHQLEEHCPTRTSKSR